MRWIASALLIAVSTIGWAAEPVIVLQSDGTAWFSAGDGSPTVQVARIVPPPGEQPPQPPKDPDDPEDPQPPAPPDANTLRERVKQWADELADPTGARILAAAYEVLAEEMQAGRLPTDSDQVDAAIATAVNKALSMIPEQACAEPEIRISRLRAEAAVELKGNQLRWQTLHKRALADISRRLVAAGGTFTREQWTAEFRAVQRGLEDAAATAGETSDWLQLVLETLIKVLIELLRGLF